MTLGKRRGKNKKKRKEKCSLVLIYFVRYDKFMHLHEMEIFQLGLEDLVAHLSFIIVIIAGIAVTALSIISLFWKHPKEKVKKSLFFSIAGVTLFATIFLAVSTIYLNNVSSSGGPVHWHADFEIWNCGQEVDLLDPEGWSNKIGTPTLHEHNDKRIHLEGVVVKPTDASLGKFFHVIGGAISPTSITFPTNFGLVTKQTGDVCPNGITGEMQVFAYRTVHGIYSQQKITDPANFIISPSGAVPPGDCIIIEFDQTKDKTDKLCRSYKVAEQLGKIRSKM